MKEPAADGELESVLAEVVSAARFIGAREHELTRLYTAQRARYARARALGATVPRIAEAAGVSDAAIHHAIRKHEAASALLS